MEELDDAGASFSLAPQQATEIGCWNYVSTRNNNFSNRSQKGTLCVDEGAYASGDVGPNGDNVVTNVGWISVPPNTVSNIQTFSMQSEPKKGLLLRKFGLNQLKWTSLMKPIRLKLPSLSSNGLSTHQNWCTEKPRMAITSK